MNRSQAEPYVYEKALEGPAFRSAELVEFAINNGMSKRTADTLMGKMVKEGSLIKARRGILVPSKLVNENKGIALASIAHKFQGGGAISLDSAMPGALSQSTEEVYLLVPSGKVGRLETALGTIHVIARSSRMMDAIYDRMQGEGMFQRGPGHAKPLHSPELALTMALYLDDHHKSSYQNDQLLKNASTVEFNWDAVRAMATAARLPSSVLRRAEANLAAGNKTRPSTTPSP